MKRNPIVLSLLSLFIAGCPAFAKITVSPIANLDIAGGQYWVTGEAPAGFGGNLDLLISPVITFSPVTTLLPIYSGKFSSTKDVTELVEGGTLTRQLQDHAISFKLIRVLPSNLKLKFRAGYKLEYLLEAKEETWGNGLFDYNKLIAGIEGEKNMGPNDLRAGLDFYTMRYPNYQSLVTQSGFQTAIDTTTYSELSSEAGKNVLDYDAVSFFADFSRAPSKELSWSVDCGVMLKSFIDQKIVQNSGMFSRDLRKDVSLSVKPGISYVTPRAALAFCNSFDFYDSNQNSFDAGNSHFTRDHYDYFEDTLSPSITFNLGLPARPVKLSFYWEISYRSYIERLAQNADGSYSDAKELQVKNLTGVTLLYPVTGSLSARFSTTYMDASSNMRFESTYKYNYYTLNYFLGINWQY
jgi:hypothetical protein